jgi:hypothetical protein
MEMLHLELESAEGGVALRETGIRDQGTWNREEKSPVLVTASIVLQRRVIICKDPRCGQRKTCGGADGWSAGRFGCPGGFGGRDGLFELAGWGLDWW